MLIKEGGNEISWESQTSLGLMPAQRPHLVFYWDTICLPKNITGATQWFCKTNSSLATEQDRVLFFFNMFKKSPFHKISLKLHFPLPLTGYSRTDLRIKIFSNSSKKLKHFDLNSEVLSLCLLAYGPLNSETSVWNGV